MTMSYISSLFSLEPCHFSAANRCSALYVHTLVQKFRFHFQILCEMRLRMCLCLLKMNVNHFLLYLWGKKTPLSCTCLLATLLLGGVYTSDFVPCDWHPGVCNKPMTVYEASHLLMIRASSYSVFREFNTYTKIIVSRHKTAGVNGPLLRRAGTVTAFPWEWPPYWWRDQRKQDSAKFDIIVTYIKE